MCGRYALNLTPEEIWERFGITEFVQLRLPPVMPRFNVAPTSVMPVVVERSTGRALDALRWGFRPAWMAPGRAPPPINARAETVATNGLFKTALSRQRCVVPATGFFEFMWTDGIEGTSAWGARPANRADPIPSSLMMPQVVLCSRCPRSTTVVTASAPRPRGVAIPADGPSES